MHYWDRREAQLPAWARHRAAGECDSAAAAEDSCEGGGAGALRAAAAAHDGTPAAAGAGVTQVGALPTPFDCSIVPEPPFVKNAVVSAADW